ncbi:hypothetical protein GPECTOR_35g942 [Gonium pectorale]|uniref:Protein kinase domain-containing protein n=1 Tax=Gonium pectorale TaxID=33097 RepID=A0A150GCD5_GONPE|nr:hypothetical protein GPECTOR_35g942 [Gonium pectorale]|eukprot:KXZ47504.1 hypothetical protein GPECTOR_35g942 [Gonium pectorale]
MVNYRVGPHFQAPGLDLLAPSAPVAADSSSWPLVIGVSVGQIQRTCLPGSSQRIQSANTIPRHPAIPGAQAVTPEVAQDGCAGDANAPPLARCWPSRGVYDNIATHGFSWGPYGNPVQANYALWILNSPFLCQDVLPLECVEQLGAVGCFYSMYPRKLSPPVPGPDQTPSAVPPQPTAATGANKGGLVSAGGNGDTGAPDDDRGMTMLVPVLGAVLGVAGAFAAGIYNKLPAPYRHRPASSGSGAVMDARKAAAAQPPPDPDLSGSIFGIGLDASASGSRRLEWSLPLMSTWAEQPSAGEGPRVSRAPTESMMVTPLTPLNPSIPLNVRLGSGDGEVQLLPSATLGKGACGRVMVGMYGGARVAVKLISTAWEASQHVRASCRKSEAGEGLHGDGDAAGEPAQREGTAAAPAPASAPDQGQHLAAAGAGAESRRPRSSSGGGSESSSSSGFDDGPVSMDSVANELAQEVEVLGRCDHPNVVRLLAASIKPPNLCLVMELMDTSLDRLLYGNDGQRPLPLPTVLHIAIQVAQALAYLHPTILHRDLKPGHVLISRTDNGRPLAKVADIYAFGVIIWEMLAGQRPWEGMTTVQIAFALTVQNSRLPLDGLTLERCPRKLRQLLTECWDGVPERRPAAEEVAKRLVLVAQGPCHYRALA